VGNEAFTSKFQAQIRSIDWKLLLFLLLFINVKVAVKAFALLLIFILRPGLKLGFRMRNSRIPQFYFLVISIAILNLVFGGLVINRAYDLSFLTGILFWFFCILAFHQVRSAVEQHEAAVIHRTLLFFFILNAVASLAVYAGIIWETGTVNPYRYQGNFQKYFISTGDYIKGLSFDTSTTNAVLNAFAVIYFLVKDKPVKAIFFMAVLLLCGSNMVNILLTLVFLYLLVFSSSKVQKSIMVVCWMMMVVFLVKISPQNNRYIFETWQKITGNVPPPKPVITHVIPVTERPDSLLNPMERDQKIAQLYLDSVNKKILDNTRKPLVELQLPDTVMTKTGKPEIPKPSIHTPPFQHKWDTTQLQKKLIQFADSENNKVLVPPLLPNQRNLPGKLIAMEQTLLYLKKHPARSLMGAGMGNFSSKLAFRTTGLRIGGGYPTGLTYISDGFRKNHLDLYLYYFARTDKLHSLTNSPNSVYDQMLGEYGVLGLFSFLVFYLGFFMRRFRILTYGIPVLILMAGIFFTDYWFEQLSVVVIFELLLLLNIKDVETKAI
jgi:hypothetical protein